MGPSSPLKLSFIPSFALFFFSLALSSSSSSLISNSDDDELYLPLFHVPELFFPQSDFAARVLSLLGTAQDAKTVPADVAKQIESCLKFLVPFSRSHWNFQENIPLRRDLLLNIGDTTGDNNKILHLPAPLLELARLAMDSGGRPSAIENALEPQTVAVPDVEGAAKDKCKLTGPTAKRFASQELNDYFAFIFELIVKRAPVGELTRYDLFHGHMFIAKNGRLGMLFHAKEYPAFSSKFPIDLGFYEKDSYVRYNERSMNLRSILWLAPLPSKTSKDWVAPGVLVALDARPDGIIKKKLVSADTPAQILARTIDQDDFGVHVVDVNYLNVPNADLGQKIFINV